MDNQAILFTVTDDDLDRAIHAALANLDIDPDNDGYVIESATDMRNEVEKNLYVALKPRGRAAFQSEPHEELMDALPRLIIEAYKLGLADNNREESQ